MLEILGTSIDFGLLILIWMVQLIVYPSFLFFEAQNLIVWHRKYTGLIAIIVVPLMLGQLGLALFDVYVFFSLVAVIKLLLITFVWTFTFAFFAPMHSRLSQGMVSKPILKQLVSLNWYRTIAWTIVSLISLINYYFV